MSKEQVEIVALGEKHFIGVPVTNAFHKADPKSIREAYQIFLSRKEEITDMVDRDCYVCPHFANDYLFTYIYCMEVFRIGDVPQGMIGFSLPSQRYAKARSADQDPYARIKATLEAMNLENNTRSLALEIFRFGEEQHVNNADVYIPIL
ncbi:GyrI-like domain-containing protein [Paenibacillus glycanilyticus]|uniref:GyrI-like domain-containing protein n=1 Tax=Paenibacillus glycanilyticus TaxID=126569 RepID=UPI00203FDB67|nr:effector binding domain-containing protein [Paenibacillus glycanilyticus]MCM3626045.1 GyrI-like domain-containing protein [Paenibacillus glycanilyticus]